MSPQATEGQAMDMYPFFKSVLDEDRSPVVICDLNHTILYMNKTAIDRYAKRGGAELIGQNLLDCHSPESRGLIKKAIAWFQAGKDHTVVYEFRCEKENKDVYMVALRDESGKLIGYYEKHESRNPETMPRYNMP